MASTGFELRGLTDSFTANKQLTAIKALFVDSIRSFLI